MGQAKARGTFEERKAQAIERDRKAAEERLRIQKQKWESMADEERQAALKHEFYEHNLITKLFGIAGMIGRGGAVLHNPYFFGPPKLKRHHMKGREE